MCSLYAYGPAKGRGGGADGQRFVNETERGTAPRRAVQFPLASRRPSSFARRRAFIDARYWEKIKSNFNSQQPAWFMCFASARLFFFAFISCFCFRPWLKLEQQFRYQVYLFFVYAIKIWYWTNVGNRGINKCVKIKSIVGILYKSFN